MLKNTKLQEMSSDEYFYLTENFEFADKNSVSDTVNYLVYNRKRRLLNTVKAVMENELTEQERCLANDYFSGELTLGEIETRYNMKKSSIYRHIGVIKKKLETSLKYVLAYESGVLPKSNAEIMEYINGKREAYT